MTLNIILSTDLSKVFTLICRQYLFSFIGSFLVLAFPKPLKKKSYTPRFKNKKVNVYLTSQSTMGLNLSFSINISQEISDDKSYIKIIIPVL